MAGQARTKTHDAGGATGSSQSSSRARGLSVVDGAKHKTSGDMLTALNELTPDWNVGPRCRMSFVLAELDEDVRTKVTHLIDETTVPASKIADVFDQFGYPDLYRSITRHRRRKTSPAMGCRCP